MSPRIQPRSLIVLAVAVWVLCGVSALGSVRVSAAPGSEDTVAAVIHGDLDSRGSTSLGEHADSEDADSMSRLDDVETAAIPVAVPVSRAERARSTRPDRPPQLAHLG